jgi:hypothetical protein
MLYPQEGLSALEKIRCDMFSEGCDAHTVRYNSLLQIKMVIWHTFLKFELAESGVGAKNFKKVHQILPFS